MKKYEFTGEINEAGLKRIRLIKHISTFKAGALGGFIEKESNLSHEGNCWVFQNAQVSGNAVVSENALVYGDVCVSGNAKIFGDAFVTGSAVLTGNAEVFGDARIWGDTWSSSPICIKGSRDFICSSTHTLISIGCVTYPKDEWLSKIVEVGRIHGYSDTEIEEYIKLMTQAIETMNKPSFG
jgi:hypothetical protein